MVDKQRFFIPVLEYRFLENDIVKNQSEIQFVDQLASLKNELQNLNFSFEFRAFFENISEDQKKQAEF